MIDDVFMNRDNILKMEAGPEMDLLVAPLVGWDHSHDYNECEDDWYTYCRNCGDEPRFSERENDCEVPPRYSTNIASAWEIVDKLKQSGFLVIRLSTGDILGNQWQFHCSDKWREVTHDGDKDYFANAATAPLAICRAALLILEDKDELQ